MVAEECNKCWARRITFEAMQKLGWLFRDRWSRLPIGSQDAILPYIRRPEDWKPAGPRRGNSWEMK